MMMMMTYLQEGNEI